MARVFADLITNQPTPPLYHTDHRGQLLLLLGISPPRILEALFIKSPEHKEETEWTVCASYELSSEHFRIIGIFIPF